MYQEKFETFDADQPLLPGASTLTLAEALICEQILVETQDAPTAEESGEALLAKTNFHDARNAHLEAERVRLLNVPAGKDAMRERIEWMWHAGSRSADPKLASRAEEAIEVMIDQVAPHGGFDLDTLADELSLLAGAHPELVAALFRGDLDDVPDLIIEAVQNGAREHELVETAAWMSVCWGALEQQREASLGWRLIHRRLDDIWGSEDSGPWTIGQIFRPKTKWHAFAHKIRKLYSDNLRRGIETLEDKRTINAIEKTLRKLGLGGINRANEREIMAMFGHGRIGRIPDLLRGFGGHADAYHRRYQRLLTGADGESRAGQRADMLTARISAVHRTAIVCARTCHLAALAAKARSSDDLRAMLGAHLPDVLRPSTNKQPRPDKLRLCQFFHVVRLEFLRDGGHLPKKLKGSPGAEHIVLPLELNEKDSRRAHEVLDTCWAELNNQPADWRFITPLGWQCDGLPRVRLRA